MFRALTCPSSGGKIVFTQHLVSSLSVNVCTVHWLRADWVRSQPVYCALKLVDEIILTENQIRHDKHTSESTDSTMFYFVIGIRLFLPLRYLSILIHVRPSEVSMVWLTQSALNQCTVQPFTESDDTRCSVNTIFPPDDGHVNARNMSRIIL